MATRARALTTMAALAALVGTALATNTSAAAADPAATGSADAGPTASPTDVAQDARAGSAVTFGGGDIIPTAPTRLVAGARGSKSWRSVAVPGSLASTFASGSLLVTITAAGATHAGQIALRPGGSPSAGNVAVTYRARRAWTGTSVVPVTASGFDWRATAGAPRVTVRAVGWVPKTSALTATDRGGSVSTTATRAARLVRLPGLATADSGTQASATALVQVTTDRAGKDPRKLSVWTPNVAPSASTAVPTGRNSYLAVLRPDAQGRLKLRATGGTVATTLTVVGFATSPVTLGAPAAERRLSSVKPGSVRTVRVSGAGGAPPADVRLALLKVTAPVGASVRVWRSSTGSAPEQAFTAPGGPITIPVRPAANGTVRIRTTGRAATDVIAAGWVTGGGTGQGVTMTPFTTTRLYGPADVAQQGAGFVTVRSTAATVPVGGHVMVRPSSDAGSYVGEVTGVSRVPAGYRLALADASLTDAFADYRVTYGNPHAVPALTSRTRSGTTVTETGSHIRRTVAQSSGTSTVTPASGGRAAEKSLPLPGDWACNVPARAIETHFDLDFDPAVDLSLAERTIDLSFKQSFSATATMAAGSYGCSWSFSALPHSIPIGTTGLSYNFGLKAQVSASLAEPTTLSGSEQAYAAFFHTPGADNVHKEAVGTNFSVTDVHETVNLDIAAFVALDLGVPGLAEEGPRLEASLDFGRTFSVGRPQDLKGPHCVDAKISPYVEFGGSLLVPVLGNVDVGVTFASIRHEFDGITLYAGKCYGYQGTIAYTEKTHQVIDGCGPQPCQVIDQSMKLTTTMLPTPARFPGEGVVFQPYSWAGSRDDSSESLSGCTRTATSSGSGEHGFGIDGERGPYIFVDSGSPRQLQFFGTSTPANTVTVTNSCPGQPTDVQVFPEGYGIAAAVPSPDGDPLDVEPAPHVTVSETFVDGDTTRTIDVNLVRVEYER